MQQRAEHVGALEPGHGIADQQLPAERLRARAQHGERLRMDMTVDEKSLRLRCGAALGERHSFRAGRRLVEQRGIGDVEAGQLRHDGLKIEAAAYCRGDRLRHQLVEGRRSDDAQHVLDVAR